MRPLSPPPKSSPVEDNPFLREFNQNWESWLFELYKLVKSSNLDRKYQELTASGAVVNGVMSVQLNHATVVIAATIASTLNHGGLFIVKNTSASGTAAHTLTLTSGTFDGTNTVATLNAPNEALVVYFDSAGNGSVVENIGSVALS